VIDVEAQQRFFRRWYNRVAIGSRDYLSLSFSLLKKPIRHMYWPRFFELLEFMGFCHADMMMSFLGWVFGVSGSE
jgi:hypothetical protein